MTEQIVHLIVREEKVPRVPCKNIPLTQDHPPSFTSWWRFYSFPRKLLWDQTFNKWDFGDTCPNSEPIVIINYPCHATENTLSYLGFWLGCLEPWFSYPGYKERSNRCNLPLHSKPHSIKFWHVAAGSLL